MIVHDHGAIVAEMGDEPLALPEILGDAFVGVIADRAEEAHRLLRNHAQPALEACDRHSGARVDVHRAVHVSPPAQDAAVQREARAIDAGPLVEVLVHADLDQVRSRDLRPQQLVLLHQELSIFSRNAHGAVVVNVVIPTMVGDKPIDRGEIDANLPFRGRYRGRWIGRGFGMDVHGESSLLKAGLLVAMVPKPASAFQRVGAQNSRPMRR